MIKNHVVFNYEDLVDSISDELKEFKKTTDINSLKTNTKLIKLVCNTADSYLTKANKVDKHNLILDVIIKLFDITHEEKILILNKIKSVLSHHESKRNIYITYAIDLFNYIFCFFY